MKIARRFVFRENNSLVLLSTQDTTGLNFRHLDADLGASSETKMVGIRAALSNSSSSNTMDICGGGGSTTTTTTAAIHSNHNNHNMIKSNNLTIQVNGDPGQQDVVSQPSGTVIVNCYKDATAVNQRHHNNTPNAIESESAVCIKVIQNDEVETAPEASAASPLVDNHNFDKEGLLAAVPEEENERHTKRCNISVNSAKKSRSTQCEDQHRHDHDQLFAKDKEISAEVNEIVGGCGDESQISDHTNNISVSGLNSSTSSSSSAASSTSNNQNNNTHNQIETDNSKDKQASSSSSASSRPQQEHRPKSFKSTEAQTDNNFLQSNQTAPATEASSSAMPIEPSHTAGAPVHPGHTNPAMVSGQSREERRRERRERRQNRALNQAGRHCHPNQRISGASVPPYEILPDVANNNHHHHLLPPPYSTLPLGSSMAGPPPPPPPIVPRLPGPPPPGHHHHHHHHQHMALHRIRSASPPPIPGPILMQAPPPPIPILQPVPVASIANAVGEDPRFLFQLPVIRR